MLADLAGDWSISDADVGARFAIDERGFGTEVAPRAQPLGLDLILAQGDIDHLVDRAMGGTNDAFSPFTKIDMAAHRGAGGRSKHSIARGLFLNAGLPYPGSRGNSGQAWRAFMRRSEKADRLLQQRFRLLMQITAHIVEQEHGVKCYADKMRVTLAKSPQPWRRRR